VELQAELLWLGIAPIAFQVTQRPLARSPVGISCDAAPQGRADGLFVQPPPCPAIPATEIPGHPRASALICVVLTAVRSANAGLA
jgi:hypothetical protein